MTADHQHSAQPESAELPAAGRRVLIIGAGRGQLGLIRAVKRLGATAVVASRTQPRPPGLDLADEVAEADILSPDEVVAAARRAGVDAVATSCLDTGLEALGAVADTLGLRGISRQTARLCADKLEMKLRLAQAGVPTANYVPVSHADEVVPALERTGLPAVVKATDLQGSSGVYMVDTAEQAQEAYSRAAALSRGGKVIIERFLDGREFGAQALIHDGQILHITVHGDDLAEGDVPVPVGHHVPMEAAPGLLAQAEEVIAAAIGALDLRDCAVNVDLMECDGVVHIIELTGRAGANGLPELMSTIYGLDYYEMVAREALDLDVVETWQSRSPWDGAAMSLMLAEPQAHGIITSISTPEQTPPWLTDLQIFKRVGDALEGFSSSNDCTGQVVVRASSVQECRQRAAQIAALISVETSADPARGAQGTQR
ncbi:ATP-grasp domain-containing protein [Actinomyces slackii]|uniref:Alanine-anticapsin ligase BacD n=1 Tax=Actinomyces slackii TaxID=52774 RepID=A0A448KFK7_9ACTO|nr:ATP-grasp domain-containing protein [Actinomyces slackii]VEG75705.1 Alanine-anticapsin ligase BacD [Actinomyces slackii]